MTLNTKKLYLGNVGVGTTSPYQTVPATALVDEFGNIISEFKVSAGSSAVSVSPNISRGTGVMDSNTTRVTLATDGPGLSNLSSIAGLSIPAHDHITLSYTGTNLTGVVYRTGGSGGTTVGTLTLSYSGSNLISIAKT